MNLTNEQKLIVKTAKNIADEILKPNSITVDRDAKFPDEGIGALSEAGILGMTIPVKYGGSGTDTTSFVLVTEEIARACPSTALIFVTHAVVAQTILVAGSDEIKERYLPAMAAGKTLGAFAVTEAGSGSEKLATATKASANGNSYIIDGTKIYITCAGKAGIYIVVGRTSEAKAPHQLTMFLVEKDTPGFTIGSIEDTMGLRGTSDGELIFDQCAIPKSNMLGKEHAFLEILPRCLSLGLVGGAGIATGIAQAAVDAAVNHAKTREIMGRAIGNHQGLQFMIADMSTHLTAAKALTYQAAMQLDAPQPDSPFPIFMSKLFATETAIDITHKALQIHGGNGYSRELPLERYYRDARGLTILFSPSESLKDQIGKMHLGLNH